MRIVIAPDSFKESLAADAVARAIATGIARVLPDAVLDLVPMADGGEGTLAALVAATGGREEPCTVHGPHGALLQAGFGILGDGVTGVIEMAAASGLALVPAAARDPYLATSYGTGELVRAALDADLAALVIAIGGSATVDGGAGLVQALGARFLRADGAAIAAPITGGQLADVAGIDLSQLDPRLARTRVEIACDVDNPLLGPRGAAAVFGPQKGATPAQVTALDAALARFYDIVEASLDVRVRERAGAGAAGGAGAALMAFLGATLRPGVALVIEAVGLDARLAGADLVITGEGRLDEQTLHGKTPHGVARVARARGIPVIAIGGGIADGADDALAGVFDAVEACVARPMSVAEALADAPATLARAGARVGRWLALARRVPRADGAD
ncbi:MAG: glycerate kinase [Gammaproteobacteria bacterium]